jgi:hypothetical protein
VEITNENLKKEEKESPYSIGMDLRESFYKDKVKPRVISDKDEYYWINYIFDGKSKRTRHVQPKLNSIGTSSICHKNNNKFKY